MGFRNPFRVQVDENDVAYLTDYSPDSQRAGAVPRPGRHGPRWRSCASRRNYGWPLCCRTDLPYYQWDFNTSTTLGEPYECGNASHGPGEHLALEHRPQRRRRRSPTRTSGTRSRTPRWGTPCLASYNDRDGDALPAAVARARRPAASARTARRSTTTTRPTRATTKFPPYYDGAVLFGEFTRDYLKEIRLDSAGKVFKINPLLNCGAVEIDGAAVRVRQPDGPAGRGRRQLLPADLRRRLLRRQPRRGHVPLRLRQGPARAARRAGRHADRRAGPAHGGRSRARARATRIPPTRSASRGTSTNDGTVDSIDPDPSFTYTANGVYTARLTVTDSSGKTDSKTTTITVGNTSPSVVDRHAARR